MKSSLTAAAVLASAAYISKVEMKKETYNPQVMRTSNYTLIDADRDGDVDAITRNGGVALVSPGMRDYIRAGDPFFDMLGYSIELTGDLQKSANKTLKGVQDESILEKELKKLKK